MPRGGECSSCRTYILWGDVIRGCYRRHAGGKVTLEEEEEETEGEEAEAESRELSDSDAMDVDDGPVAAPPLKRGRGRPRKSLELTQPPALPPAPVTVKRGGRPRKSLSPARPDVLAPIPVPNSLAPPPVSPKKRGRPRKEMGAVPIAGPSPPKAARLRKDAWMSVSDEEMPNAIGRAKSSTAKGAYIASMAHGVNLQFS